jgi:hypothetical protein
VLLLHLTPRLQHFQPQPLRLLCRPRQLAHLLLQLKHLRAVGIMVGVE